MAVLLRRTQRIREEYHEKRDFGKKRTIILVLLQQKKISNIISTKDGFIIRYQNSMLSGVQKWGFARSARAGGAPPRARVATC